jgi:hypothetical protein
MALSAFTIWEMETTGSDTVNGGAFDPSQTAGMFTDGAATSAKTVSPVFASASYNFVAGDVGAWVYIGAGATWFAGWYKIVSVAANTATLSAAIGAAVYSTGGTTAVGNGRNTLDGCSSAQSPTGATWTIDYSQQAAARYAYTDLASAGAGLTVSSAAKPFSKEQVGNCLVITGGTNFTAGRYVIASVAAGVATVVGAGNITTLAGVSGTGGQGGALASPGQSQAAAVAGNDFFQAAGTYTVTSASTNIAAGCVSMIAGSSTSNATKWTGYQTVRYDNGTKPIIKSDGVITTFVLFTTAGNNYIDNIEVDGNNRSSSRGMSLVGNSEAVNCRGRNCTNSAFSVVQTAIAVLCEATGCSTQGAILGGNLLFCVAHDNTVTGITLNANANTCMDCLSYNNTGATSDGFFFSATQNQAVSCTAYANGRSGFNNTAIVAPLSFILCLSVNNGAFGFASSSTSDMTYTRQCAGYNNTSGNFSGIAALQQIGFVTLTADPFTNAAGADFSLNNTTGGGHSLRGAGNITLPITTTVSYPDIGGVQGRSVGSVGTSAGGYPIIIAGAQI